MSKAHLQVFSFWILIIPGNNKNPGYDSKLSQYTEDTPTDVYYIQKDGAMGIIIWMQTGTTVSSGFTEDGNNFSFSRKYSGNGMGSKCKAKFCEIN